MKGDLIVVAGTNEVGVEIKDSGPGTFLERKKEGILGEIEIFARMPDHLAQIYWDRVKELNEEMILITCYYSQKRKSIIIMNQEVKPEEALTLQGKIRDALYEFFKDNGNKPFRAPGGKDPKILGG